MTQFIESIVAFFEVAIKFAPKFLPAVGLTLQLSVLSILLGTLFGLLVTLLKLTRLKLLESITNVYISIVRGTPLLLQLYFIYFGLPKLGLEFDSFTSAVIGLAFHSGAYISEIFRGAINAVHYGQEEAGKAIGLNRFQIFYYIILPQAVKQAIPALGNQFIIAVKDSSLASVITITETMLIARQFVAATYNPFPILFVAGCYYYIIITLLSAVLRRVERRLQVNER